MRVEGLENVPLTGPVILAANHRDNLDGLLLLYLLPRTVHFAARTDGFGTGTLYAFWRRLGTFPADAWGMRHALSLLADGLHGRHRRRCSPRRSQTRDDPDAVR